jgi:hypothetical protein
MPGRRRFVTEIVIAPHGRSWAVRHNGGFLGYAESQPQAMMLAQALVEWLMDQDRGATLAIEALPSAAADADHEKDGSNSWTVDRHKTMFAWAVRLRRSGSSRLKALSRRLAAKLVRRPLLSGSLPLNPAELHTFNREQETHHVEETSPYRSLIPGSRLDRGFAGRLFHLRKQRLWVLWASIPFVWALAVRSWSRDSLRL